MKLPWKRDSTMRNQTSEKHSQKDVLQMITTDGGCYYEWNNRLYESDIIRACIRPKVKAISRLSAKHIRDDPENGLKVNPDANIRFLLSEPNPFMTMSQMQEKVGNQLCLNNNAFILIVRDENGKAMQLYPIPCKMVEKKYSKEGELFLLFRYGNGKSGLFRYSDIIHLRQDYYDDDVFGTSPAEALKPMMQVIGTIDQGIINAIKNSSVVRWLIKYSSSMREEDIKKNVANFVKNYLAIETETFGAAGVDAKADVQRIEPKDYVPNAAQTDRTIERIYSFFNTNKKIVQSSFTEDEWNAYYEAEIEPVVVQMQQTYSVGIFTRKGRGFGNKIVFESNNLQCASLTTKLAFVGMVDRGAMLVNEWREILNLAPLEGGDVPIRRLDTQVVNLIEDALGKMNKDNCESVAGIITRLLDCANKGGEMEDEAQD